MIALLSKGNKTAVQALLTSPEKIAAALVLFSEHELTDSAIIAQKLLRILTDGRASIVKILLESQEQLSNSIRVFSLNTITDPGVILMILERADDSVIRLMMDHPQKLADIILSSVGTKDIQTWWTVLSSVGTKDIQTGSTVDLMIRIQVPPLDQ